MGNKTIYLYLADHFDGARFKIGISNNPLIRLTYLSEIEMSSVLIVNCNSAADVEKALHGVYHRFNMKGLDGDGKTEMKSSLS